MLAAFDADIWVENPIYKGIRERASFMLHPQPRLQLSPLKNLLCIYYPLLEGNHIPLVPYTSNDICPYPFPDLILIITNLKQVKTLEMQLQIMLLYE